jgi:transposase
MKWRRGRSYGQDLRDKMFVAIDGGMAPGVGATALAVSVSWIYKALGRRRETDETSARPQHCHVPGKLDGYHAEIRAQVAAVPDITILELRAWVLATRGVSVSHVVMWETLCRLKLTLKKDPACRRAGASGCRRSARAVAYPAAHVEPGKTRLYRRNLGYHQHVPAVWPRPQRPAVDRCRAARALANHTFLTGLRHSALVAPLVIDGAIDGAARSALARRASASCSGLRRSLQADDDQPSSPQL